MPSTLLTYVNVIQIIIEFVPCQASVDEELCPYCHHHMTMPGGRRFPKRLWL